MRGVGTAAAVSVVGVGSMGSASAEVGIDWDADLAPETRARATPAVDVDISEEELADLDYLDADGNTQSLFDHGYSLRSADEGPDNPVSIDIPEITRDEAEDEPIAIREVEETEDDETTVVEEEVYTHDGVDPLWITSLDTLDPDLIDDIEGDELGVEYEVVQYGRDVASDLAYTEEVEVDEDDVEDTISGMDQRLRSVVNHQFVDDAGITWAYEEIVFTGIPEDGADRYEVAGYSPDESSAVTRMDDALNLNLSSVTDDMDEDAVEAGEVVVELTEIVAGDYLVTVVDVGLTEDELDGIESSGFMGGAAGGTADNFFSGAQGTILAIAGLVGGLIAWARGRAGDGASSIGGLFGR